MGCRGYKKPSCISSNFLTDCVKEIMYLTLNFRSKLSFQISKLDLKGVFSKPSGKCIIAPNLCFLS